MHVHGAVDKVVMGRRDMHCNAIFRLTLAWNFLMYATGRHDPYSTPPSCWMFSRLAVLYRMLLPCRLSIQLTIPA